MCSRCSDQPPPNSPCSIATPIASLSRHPWCCPSTFASVFLSFSPAYPSPAIVYPHIVSPTTLPSCHGLPHIFLPHLLSLSFLIHVHLCDSILLSQHPHFLHIQLLFLCFLHCRFFSPCIIDCLITFFGHTESLRHSSDCPILTKNTLISSLFLPPC